MELNGQPAVPILTFAQFRDAEELISAGGSSWMHEHICGMFFELDEGEEAG